MGAQTRTAPTWRAPVYGRGLSEVMPAALDATTPDGDDVFGLGPVRAVIVLVVDGLGWQQLHAHRDVAPTMTRAAGHAIDVGFPSTTVTSLASMGTGLTPGMHGLLGTSLASPHDDRPFNLLAWGFGRQDAAESAVDTIVPEVFQPRRTVFERAAHEGVAVTTVLRPHFVGSGLTRAVFRGARRVHTSGLAATLAAAFEAATRPDGRALVYCYHPQLDMIGHARGPHTDAWLDALADLDEHVRNLARRLPGDARLVITADHGMLPIPDDSLVELADDGLMEGVTLLAGEARARHVHTAPGARDDVRAGWRERLDGFAVVTRDEAIAAGWFGSEVAPEHRARIGDLVAIATAVTGGLVHRDLDARGGRLAGMHGSLTPAELEVPLLTIGRDDGA